MDDAALLAPPQPPVTEPSVAAETSEAAPAPAAPRARRRTTRQPKPRCEDCFFLQNQLCALEEKKPCPTFRPAHPDGLRPPRQLSFAFRADRRTGLPAPPQRDL